jgi:hypothetical protein
MLPDQPIEMLQRRRGKAEAGGIAGWQRIVVGHGCLLQELGDAMLHDTERFHYL